jgi:hypothetical protein
MSQESKWVEVEISEEMLANAKKYAGRHSDIPNSIRKGRGNLAGYLGEQAVMEYTQDCVIKHTKDYDMYLRFMSSNPIAVDVKTKERTVNPKDFYTCHVAEASMHQECDMYVFCQVNIRPKMRAWILGWITKEDFIKESVQLKKGESLKDVGYNDDDFKQRADGNVILISELRDIKKLP